MSKVSGGKIFITVLTDQIRTILYFPFWWYSKGFLKVLKGSGSFIIDFEQTLGLGIWVKNLFVPMFGQTDFAGRMISVFLRLFQIIWKCLVLVVIIILTLIFVIVWLALPIFIIYEIVINL
jgi:hypothetical protein